MLDDLAVGLNLGFARTTHSDAALLALQVGPHAGQSGQQVLVLGQFDLRSRIGSLGAGRKNIEDEVGAVHDLDLQKFLNVFELRGAELVVEDYEVNLVFAHVFFDLVHFAGTQEEFGVGTVEFLGKEGHRLRSGGFGQKAKFVEVLLYFGFVLKACDGTY